MGGGGGGGGAGGGGLLNSIYARRWVFEALILLKNKKKES